MTIKRDYLLEDSCLIIIKIKDSPLYFLDFAIFKYDLLKVREVQSKT
jgi:hypothetical protein